MSIIRTNDCPPDLPSVRTITVPKFRKLYGRQKKECTWCGARCPGRRYHWCSEKCYNTFREHYDPGYIRHETERRDKGVCSVCRRDCEYWERQYRKAITLAKLWPRINDRCDSAYDPTRKRKSNRRGRKNRKRIKRFARQFVRLHRYYDPLRKWEADHIIPVVEGGGGLGLENIRTLCLRCHKAETAALAGRRKKQRSEP